MDERVVQFRVGVMVLATLLIAAILVVMFNEPRTLMQGRYAIRVRFPQAPGVTENTPIRKSGILIGRVSQVELADEGGAIVTAKIDTNRQLRHNEQILIARSLLGDAVLEVVPRDDPQAPETIIKHGETLDGAVRADAIQVIGNLEESLSEAIDSVADTSSELGTLVRKIGDVLDQNKEQIHSVIARADQTLISVQETVNGVNEVVGDPVVRDRLKRAVADLPQMIEDTHTTINEIGNAVTAVEENLQNVKGFTEPLGRRGEVLMARIDQGTEKLDQLIAELLVFGRSLNNRESSLGQFVHDRELYDHLNRAAKNIDELSRQLKPIVKDARIFSDKIARHPEMIGVRGAMSRSPGIK